MLMPYRMTAEGGGEEPDYRVYSSGFEPVLKNFVARVGTAGGWEPTLEWTPPVALPGGTVLTTAHLQATANVPGTFTYSPAVGAALPASGTAVLTATFTPADDADGGDQQCATDGGVGHGDRLPRLHDTRRAQPAV
jgi:hypothetical protein